MGVFSAPTPASGPQRPASMLSGAALFGPTPLPWRQPIACSRRMPAQSATPAMKLPYHIKPYLCLVSNLIGRLEKDRGFKISARKEIRGVFGSHPWSLPLGQ